MEIERAYTAGSDGLEGYYGVIVFKGGRREMVLSRAWVHEGRNVEPYVEEGNFDTREQARMATRRRLAKLRGKGR